MVQQFFILCSGADARYSKKPASKGEQNKYAGMAGNGILYQLLWPLSPSAFTALSLSSTMSTFLCFLCLIWGLLFLISNRLLSPPFKGRTNSFLKVNFYRLPLRIILAVIIRYLISKPFGNENFRKRKSIKCS